MIAQILVAEDVSKSFAGVQALDDVSFGIGTGQYVGLIGPNGSGKSTLFNIVSGVLEPTSGTISYHGEDVTGKAPHEIANRGAGRTFQTTRLFDKMTVSENVLAISDASRAEIEAYCRDFLSQFDLEDMIHLPAGDLSYGQQKIVSLGRILYNKPDLLLLDELYAGVNPTFRNYFDDILMDYQDDGGTILHIEHNTEKLMELAEDMLVLSNGRLLRRGLPTEIREDKDVIDAYLGE